MAPNKRKRTDNADGGDRPSPHRPSDLDLGRRTEGGPDYADNYSARGRGGPRRGQRGGRRGSSQASSPVDGRPGPRQFVSKPGDDIPNGSNNSQATPSQPVEPSPTPQPQPIAQPPPAVQPTQESSEPPTDLPYFSYDLITKEIVESWAESGRTTVVEAISEISQGGEYIPLSTAFTEVIRAGLEGRIDASEAGAVVKEVLTHPSPGETDPAVVFLDTLSILCDSFPFHIRLKTITLATNISANLMREILDEPLLLNLGLVGSTFGRMFIRKQTNILYRQSNYNLLREESEGYSKLLAEFFATTSNMPPSAEVVESAFERIKALIGAFDMDAGRVLDVTLDVFANLLVKHHRFFIKFLRISSFWPQEKLNPALKVDSPEFGSLPCWAEPGHPRWTSSDEDRAKVVALKTIRDQRFWEQARESGIVAFFGLGGRRILEGSELAFNTENPPPSDNDRNNETREWIKLTHTLPPRGNEVAAQLLGFKLKYYASQARNADDTMPDNLIWLAALLIKIGFISLRDLYAHLYHPDSDMDAVKEKAMADKEAREKLKRPGAAQPNALAMAGALPDDEKKPEPPMDRLRRTGRAETPGKTDTPATKAPEAAATEEPMPQVEELPVPDDQKINLLCSLLCIGAIPEALYMLGRFPWLVDGFPDVAQYLNRIISQCISKLYESLLPLEGRESLKVSHKLATIDPASTNKTDLKLYGLPPAKVLRWPKMDKRDVDDGFDYKYFWDDWADNVPVCQTVDDLFTLCRTFLNLSGPKIGKDPVLLIKIIRIGRHSLDNDFSQANQDRWLDLCRRLLCPAMSVCGSNSAIVDELWDILRRFSTRTRFTVYAEWFTGPTSRKSDLADAFNLTRYEARAVLKRMNKENVVTYARKFAKVACASPGIVFEVCLNQIESYDNLSDLVVECGRFFSSFTYDVLSWAILRALGTTKAGRSRIADTGFTTSKWLQNLSRLCAGLFKRYFVMSPLPVLEYVLDQLHRDNFTDLLILKDMVTAMAGINANPDFSEAQVEAMAGGELLQAQIMKQVDDRRYDSRVSSKRLMSVLRESGLLEPFLVAIAQQRQKSIDQDDYDDLKIIGENFDELHNITFQYLEMILYNAASVDSEVSLPDPASLISEFGLQPSMAFAIHRRSIAKIVESFDASKAVQKVQTNGDVEMKDVGSNATPKVASPETTGETTTEASTNPSQDLPTSENITTPEASGSGLIETNESPPKLMQAASEPWHPALVPVMENIRAALPEGFEQTMSLPFFVTFWQLSLQDMSAPTKSYNTELSFQNSKKQRITRDRTDLTAAGMKKKEKEKKEIDEFVSKLTEEMKGLVRRFGAIRNRLEAERTHWFSGFRGKHKELATAILKTCFIPRLLLSPIDAHFTHKMLMYLHSSGAPGFSTMHLLDTLLSEKSITNIIYRSSSREADNFGRFLYETLKELHAWHGDRTVYEKRAFGQKKDLHGFAQAVADGKPTRFLEFEEFRRLLFKWHRRLHDSLKSSLGSLEYMHIINAICVLRRVSRVFPAVNFMGKSLMDVVNKIVERERKDSKNPDKVVREDLTVAASSVLGHLKSREKSWVMPQAFQMNDASQRNQNATTRAASSAPRSPAPDFLQNKHLDPHAPTFEPKPTTPNPETTAPAALNAKGEVEDGEVEDVHMKDAPTQEKTATESKPSETQEAAVSKEAVEQKKEPAQTADNSENNAAEGSEADHKPALPPVRPTPPPTESTPRSRPQTSRTNSHPTGPANTSHGLPNRPEPPNRGRPDPNHGRLERPADLLLSRQPDRRPQSPSVNASAPGPTSREQQRDSAAVTDRPPRSIQDEPRSAPRRDTRQTVSERPSVDRLSRHAELENSPSRPDSRGHPETRSGYAHPERPPHAASPYARGTGSAYHDESRSHPRSRPTSPGHEAHAGYAPPSRRGEWDDRAISGSGRPPLHESHGPNGSYPPEHPRGSGYGASRRPESMQLPPSRGPTERPPPRTQAPEDYRRGPQDGAYGAYAGRSGTLDPLPPNGEPGRSLRGGYPEERGHGDGRMPAPPARRETPSSSRPPQTRRETRPEAQSPASAAPPSPAAAETSGIHPSRLGIITAPQATQPQTTLPPSSAGASRSGLPPSPSSSNPPSGPRGARPQYGESQAPQSRPPPPSSSTREPPTGPSSGPHDRRSANDDRRRFAGLQDTLDKSGSAALDRVGEHGPGIRGRAAVSQGGSLESRQGPAQPQPRGPAGPTGPPQGREREEPRPPRDEQQRVSRDPVREPRETRYREERNSQSSAPPRSQDIRSRMDMPPSEPPRRDDPRPSDREYRKREPSDRERPERRRPEREERDSRIQREPRNDGRELFPAAPATSSSNNNNEPRNTRRNHPLPAQEDAFNGPQVPRGSRAEPRSYGGSIRGTKRQYPDAEGEERKRPRRSGP